MSIECNRIIKKEQVISAAERKQERQCHLIWHFPIMALVALEGGVPKIMEVENCIS